VAEVGNLKVEYLREFQAVCKKAFTHVSNVADPDLGSGAFLPQGSGIRIRDDFFPDLCESRIPTMSQFQYIFKILPLKMVENRKI
jgi:hypothetical protein